MTYAQVYFIYRSYKQHEGYTGRHLGRRSGLGTSYEVPDTPCYWLRRSNRTLYFLLNPLWYMHIAPVNTHAVQAQTR